MQRFGAFSGADEGAHQCRLHRRLRHTEAMAAQEFGRTMPFCMATVPILHRDYCLAWPGYDAFICMTSEAWLTSLHNSAVPEFLRFNFVFFPFWKWTISFFRFSNAHHLVTTRYLGLAYTGYSTRYLVLAYSNRPTSLSAIESMLCPEVTVT